MLKRWREEIEEAVSEGKTRDKFASIYVPHAKTEAEKIALTLIHFQKIEHDTLPKGPAVQAKEKKGVKLPEQLLLLQKYSSQLK